MRIGIPRAFLYYHYFALWRAFFTDLGCEVVVSPPTRRSILERGLTAAEDESCLPVKVAYGHVAALAGKVDYVFLPYMKSVETKRYLCPKIIGLPDMIAHNLPGLPPLLRPEVNVYADVAGAERAYLAVGAQLGFPRERCREAFRCGTAAQEEFRRLVEEGFLPEEACARLEGREVALPAAPRGAIAVIGHSYLSCDSFVTMDLVGRLREAGYRVLISDSLSAAEVDRQAERLSKDMFWSFGRRLMSAGFHFGTREDVRGVILLTAFSCGADSMVEPFIVHAAAGKPFLNLTVDEHSGEAGLVTRLEAFLDMIERRWSA